MHTTTLHLLAELLLDLERAGIQEVRADGGRLLYRPRSAMTPVLTERLKAHKVDLLVALSPMAMGTTPRPAADDPLAGWVRRQDYRGRWGWERPGLAEADRWWARWDYDALPTPPMADGNRLAHQEPHGGVPVVSVDTLDLGGDRPLQGHFRGFGGT